MFWIRGLRGGPQTTNNKNKHKHIVCVFRCLCVEGALTKNKQTTIQLDSPIFVVLAPPTLSPQIQKLRKIQNLRVTHNLLQHVCDATYAVVLRRCRNISQERFQNSKKESTVFESAQNSPKCRMQKRCKTLRSTAALSVFDYI